MYNKYAISVVIPTYNRCEYLSYTLESLCKQTVDESEFEVVVVDDGSSDDTFQMIKTFENRLNIRYVYQADKGYRAASARNLGIRVAKGEICLFIDSGIIVKSDCLERHLDRHHAQRSEVVVIGYTYGYTQYGESEEELAGIVDPLDPDGSIAKLAEIGRFCDTRDNIYRKYNDRVEDLSVPWTLFFGGHLSIKKSSLFEVSLFDENYDGNWGCEDNDLGYRLYHAGKKIVLYREAAVLHLPHGSNTDAIGQQGVENCRYFHGKFQTPATQLFLDCYINEISGEGTIDFHERLTTAKNDHVKA